MLANYASRSMIQGGHYVICTLGTDSFDYISHVNISGLASLTTVHITKTKYCTDTKTNNKLSTQWLHCTLCIAMHVYNSLDIKVSSQNIGAFPCWTCHIFVSIRLCTYKFHCTS